MQKVILRMGIPSLAEEGVFYFSKLLTQIFIVGMGTAAIAANAMGSTVIGFLAVPCTGFQTGILIFVGQRIGRGETDEIVKTSRFITMISMAVLCIFSLAAFPFTERIISIFHPTPSATEILRNLLYVAYIAVPLFHSYSFIAQDTLRAAGDVKFTMLVSMLGTICLRVVLAYFLGVVLHLGLMGIMIGMFTDWAVKGIVFQIRLSSGKWKNRGI